MAAASPSGSCGSTSRPVTPSWTSSGMPERRVATTGTPLAIASISATGMPSILPLGSRTEGSAKARASASVARTSLGRPRSEQATRARPRRARARVAAIRSRSGPSPTSSSTTPGPALGQQGERVDQVQRGPSSATGSPRTRRGRARGPAGRARRSARCRRRSGPPRRARRRAAFEQHAAVVLGDRDHEARVGDLAVEQHRGHEEVVGVRGEAERDAGQPVHDPGRGRRVAGEVRVHVVDPLARGAARDRGRLDEHDGLLGGLHGRRTAARRAAPRPASRGRRAGGAASQPSAPRRCRGCAAPGKRTLRQHAPGLGVNAAPRRCGAAPPAASGSARQSASHSFTTNVSVTAGKRESRCRGPRSGAGRAHRRARRR